LGKANSQIVILTKENKDLQTKGNMSKAPETKASETKTPEVKGKA
jgi:hypothetical protein